MVDGLFFLHNPKAGGTSVMSALRALFSYEQQCPRIENDATEHCLHAGRYGAYAGYSFYAGHYGRDIHDKICARAPCVTNFRWPVARIVSLYRYFRFVVEIDDAQMIDPRFRAVAMAKTLSLDDFVTCDDPAVEIHTRDHHFRQLTGSGWSLDSDGELAQARAFIDAMPWFFVCEHPQESMIWAETVFRGRVGPVPHLNETSAAEAVAALSSSAYRVLDAKNQRDLALYRHAVDGLLRAISPTADPVREPAPMRMRA